MDAFYASVEQRDRPELRGRPVAVGGTGQRGVVAAASYEARQAGVRSAMPMARARRLCRELVVVPPDFDRYGEESRIIRAIFESFTPLVEPLALDEAFLDVSGWGKTGPEAGEAIRRRIREERGLAASVGVASVKFLAKIASRHAKPDGMLVVDDGRELAFLHPLPVGELWGVGPATLASLERLGVSTVGQLAETPRETLERALGAAVGAHLHDLAHGRDPRPVDPDLVRKSVSAERTFEHDLTEEADIDRQFLRLADEVGERLRRGEHSGRTVSIKVRRADFSTITRSHTLADPTDSAAEIVATARRLWASLRWRTPRVRLLGIGVSGLVDGQAPVQLRLDAPDWTVVESAVDAVRTRFGDGAVGRASLTPGRATGGLGGGADKAGPEPDER